GHGLQLPRGAPRLALALVLARERPLELFRLVLPRRLGGDLARREDRRMKETVGGVWRWTWFSEEKGMEFNGYAIKLPEGLVLIDPAYADDAVWDELAKLG